MGSIFANQSIRTPSKRSFPMSHRKAQYIAAKAVTKTDRKQVQKKELELTIEYCKWLRETFPGVHFRTDTGSGDFSSEWEKEEHNKQQSSTKLPDITILAMRRGYGALMQEIKADGEELKMKRNGTKIRVKRKRVPPSKRYPTGWKILERDYKVRLKGDWASLHIEQQHDKIEELRAAGYAAMFGVGLEQLKEQACWYFDTPYIKNVELF